MILIWSFREGPATFLHAMRCVANSLAGDEAGRFRGTYRRGPASTMAVSPVAVDAASGRGGPSDLAVNGPVRVLAGALPRAGADVESGEADGQDRDSAGGVCAAAAGSHDGEEIVVGPTAGGGVSSLCFTLAWSRLARPILGLGSV